jgi:hypothetical protein
LVAGSFAEGTVVEGTFCHKVVEGTFCHKVVEGTFCHKVLEGTFCHKVSLSPVHKKQITKDIFTSVLPDQNAGIVGHSHVPDVVCMCAGDVDSSRESGWRVLPYDLEERILGVLPSADLARVSATNRLFEAALTHQLEKEAKARCELALEAFGPERIACVADVIARSLRGEAGSPGELLKHKEKYPWVPIQADYYYRPDVTDAGIDKLLASGRFCMYTPLQSTSSAASVSLFWGWPKYSRVNLRICRHKGVTLTLNPRGDEDVQGVALLQALLSGSYGPAFHGVDRPLTIHVLWQYRPGRSTKAGQLAYVAPLLPLVSRYTLPRPSDWRSGLLEQTPDFVWKPARIRKEDASRGIALRISPEWLEPT